MIGVTYEAELPHGSHRAGCQTCRRVFMTPVLFDQHRALGRWSCADLADDALAAMLGLTRMDTGVWATPGQVEQTERLELARDARRTR